MKDTPNYTKLQDSLIYGLAGLLGNTASGIFYPLELVKIRLQVDENNKSFKQITKDIYHKEGLRGFFRGFYYTSCASGLSYVMFFSFLEYLNNISSNKGSNYDPKKQMLCSYFSALATSLVTMPLWTLRVRISLLTLDKSVSRHLSKRLSFFSLVVKESLLNEGFFRLYKGVFSSVVLSLHGGVQMTIYESGKQLIVMNRGEMRNYEGSLLGVFSKTIATFVLYPFNVIRSKQQQFSSNNLNESLKSHMIISQNRHGLFFNSVKTIYTASGFRGFYRGLTPSLLRQIPGSSLFFYTYEYTLKMFNIRQ